MPINFRATAANGGEQRVELTEQERELVPTVDELTMLHAILAVEGLEPSSTFDSALMEIDAANDRVLDSLNSEAP